MKYRDTGANRPGIPVVDGGVANVLGIVKKLLSARRDVEVLCTFYYLYKSYNAKRKIYSTLALSRKNSSAMLLS